MNFVNLFYSYKKKNFTTGRIISPHETEDLLFSCGGR